MAFSTLLAAAGLMLVWLVCAAILAGIGSLVLHESSKSIPVSDAFWMGLAVAVALLEIWSLLCAMTPAAALLLASAGAGGIAWNWHRLFRSLRGSLRELGWPIVFYVAIVAYVALRSSGPADYYDTGLYGATAVRWISTHAVIPGLANLHDRLGFNSSVLLCDAALRQAPWPNLWFHFFSGLMLSALLAVVVPPFLRVLRNAPAAAADYFHSVLMIPAFLWATRAKIAGTPTDEPAAVVCLVAAGILFSELSREKSEAGDMNRTGARMAVAIALLAVGITFKLSVIVFSVVACMLALIRLLWLAGKSRNLRAWVAASVAISAAIIVPWIIRGAMLSGYPFYPSKICAISADWRLPAAMADVEAMWVRSFALTHTYAPIAWDKVAPSAGIAPATRWLLAVFRLRDAVQVPLLVSLAGAAVLLLARSHRSSAPISGSRSLPSRGPLWLLLPSFAAIIFWFIEAPDPRFAQAPIWTLAATLGALAVQAIVSRSKWLRPRLVASGLIAAMVWCLFSFYWRESYRGFLSARGLAPLPIAAVAPRRTDSGLIVFVPSAGDQCWDAPLPCTPYFNRTLRLRSPGNPAAGFASEGLPDLPQN